MFRRVQIRIPIPYNYGPPRDDSNERLEDAWKAMVKYCHDEGWKLKGAYLTNIEEVREEDYEDVFSVSSPMHYKRLYVPGLSYSTYEWDVDLMTPPVTWHTENKGKDFVDG